jgi:hypothetical protein
VNTKDAAEMAKTFANKPVYKLASQLSFGSIRPKNSDRK